MSKSEKKTSKKKYKFTVMDYITIGFTAVIVIIMIIFLIRALKPEWFAKKSDNGSTVSTVTQPASTANSDATPAPTETPVYSGIGNSYGNMSNDSVAAEIDGYVFRASNTAEGASLLFGSGETAKTILEGENAITGVNVIEDPFANTGVAGSVYYKIIFIDGAGRLSAVTYGPLPADEDSSVDPEGAISTEKTAVAEGTYRSAVPVGEYVYAIDGDGYIVKIALGDGSVAKLSKKTYSALCVYFGAIYGLSEDGGVYILKTSPRPAEEGSDNDVSESGDSEAEAAAEVDEYEKLIGEGNFTSMAVFDDWVYAAGGSGIVRFDADYFGRDTLTSAVKPSAISVDRRGIFVLVNETSTETGEAELVLYVGAAKDFLSGTLTRLASVKAEGGESGGYGITLLTGEVLVTDGNGRTLLSAELSA
jgi:hypothetical protein